MEIVIWNCNSEKVTYVTKNSENSSKIKENDRG